ncbi:hypothetical protein GQ457_05G016230 [Hibiscus cannabinus]
MEQRIGIIKSNNATVWGWSERRQMERGDSLTPKHVSEVIGPTMIVSKQNDLRELKEIWRGWNLSTKQTFQHQFVDIALLLEVQNDVHLYRALAQFWNPGYNCFTFGKVDMTPTIEEYTLLLNCPKFKEGKVYIRPKEAPTFLKNLTDITGMSAEWFQGKITEKRKSASISWVHIRTLINLFPNAPKKELLFALCIYGLVLFPKVLGHLDYGVVDLFSKLQKGINPAPAILAETFH